jgi:post-segregation antitoxin (ccd killing protein)
MTKVKTSVIIDKELIDWAKKNGVNVSFELRKALRDRMEREKQ